MNDFSIVAAGIFPYLLARFLVQLGTQVLPGVRETTSQSEAGRLAWNVTHSPPPSRSRRFSPGRCPTISPGTLVSFPVAFIGLPKRPSFRPSGLSFSSRSAPGFRLSFRR